MKTKIRAWLVSLLLKDELLSLRSEINKLSSRVKITEQFLYENTQTAVDVGFSRRDASYAIVVGKYNGRDYVQTFELRADHLSDIINELRYLERNHGRVRRVDAPQEFRAIMDHAGFKI